MRWKDYCERYVILMDLKKLARKNTERNPLRSTLLIIISAVLAFTLFIGSFLIINLGLGIESLKNRLGADVMVLPKEAEGDLERVFLVGNPSTFYLDKGIMNLLDDSEIVEMTPQVYVATLSAGCCSFPIQAIGFDEKTDFIVGPWIRESYKESLGENELIAGSNVFADVGEERMFFSRDFKVVKKLENSGMGFDNSVFVNMDTARTFSRLSSEILGEEDKFDEDKVSCILIRAKGSPRHLAIRLNEKLKGTGAVARISASMFSDTGKKMTGMFRIIIALLVGVWIFSSLVLIVLFYYSVNERKAEYGALRAIGARRGQLMDLATLEALNLTSKGGLTGAVLAVIIGFLFNSWLRNALALPYMMAPIYIIAILFLVVTSLAVFTGPIAARLCMKRILKEDIALLGREM